MSYRCLAFIGVLPVVILVVSLAPVPLAAQGRSTAEEITTSGRVVLLLGDSSEDVTLPVPACGGKTEFLVTGLYVAPETQVGNTGNDVVNLGRWAASAAVYQCISTTCIQVPLTVLGNGPQHLSGRLEGGQGILGGSGVAVNVRTLPVSAPNTARHEFNIHVTGRCGVPFLAP